VSSRYRPTISFTNTRELNKTALDLIPSDDFIGSRAIRPTAPSGEIDIDAPPSGTDSPVGNSNFFRGPADEVKRTDTAGNAGAEIMGLDLWVFCTIAGAVGLVIAIAVVVLIWRAGAQYTTEYYSEKTPEPDPTRSFVMASRAQEEMDLAQHDFANPLLDDETAATCIDWGPFGETSTDDELL
jgi:hypothetical protein